MKLSAGFLSTEALIHLRGKAVPEFLQGQLSCDTRRLDSGTAVCGALCNVKGRVLSDLLVIRLSSDHCLLRLRASIADEVAETLRRYAQFSRIAVERDPGGRPVAGLLGEAEALEQAFPHLPEKTGSWLWQDGQILVRRGATQAELLLVDDAALESPSDAMALESALKSALKSATEFDTMQPLSEFRWQSETLLGGHYAIEAADSGLYTPQALNYDLAGLVAFDKGCYTGQEVIARLHYKGRSKRRLQVYRCAIGKAEVDAGAAVLSAAGDSVGKILRVEDLSSETRVLAAEVSAELVGTELQLEDGSQLHPADLDYVVPAA